MATFSTPLPAPVKNDWLPTGENPRLSPPSPGGPRKNAPVQQVDVRRNIQDESVVTILFLFLRDPSEVQEDEAHRPLQLEEDQLPLFQTDQAEVTLSYKCLIHKGIHKTQSSSQVQHLQFQVDDQQVAKLYPLRSFHRKC